MFSEACVQYDGAVGEYTKLSENGNQVTRTFCAKCGSSLFGRNSGMQGFLTINLGTFDDSSPFAPQVTVFARNRKGWDVMDENLPAYEAQPAWKPDSGD